MQKELIKRLYSLLTIKESAANIPKNLEARRRLEFFTNSLFMEMSVARPVRKMLSFSVFTLYHSESVLYSMSKLLKKNVKKDNLPKKTKYERNDQLLVI
ncbi:hypothetical protein RDI58_000153 [Solanum bulbocastanum]|uniref:Glycosyl transferase 48 domain-containing protein n=1 Tax=Solanum bulbocastanum TaxID=147425 RepID=A0AAN8U5L5_SOLBU